MLTKDEKKRIDTEWRTHKQLLLFIARWKCGGNVDQGKELLMKAILAVIEGTHPWDHEKYPFVTHMRYVMFDLHKADSRLVEHVLVERLVTSTTEKMADGGLDPEEVLRGKRMFETLVAACPEGSDERKIAECAAGGVHDLKKQADALGIDVDRVYAARERLHGIIERLLKRMNLKLVTP